MRESNAPYIIILIFIAGLIALYINLDNQPRAEPGVINDPREQFSIDAEHESLKESYRQEAQDNAKLETVRLDTITTQEPAEASEYDEADFELMCRIVMNEAGGESYRCQVAVAETILNRVASGEFPNNISDVIYQPYQYSHHNNGEITDSVREAVWQAMQYRIFDSDMVYFRMDYYHEFDDAEDYMCVDNTYFSLKNRSRTDQSKRRPN